MKKSIILSAFFAIVFIAIYFTACNSNDPSKTETAPLTDNKNDSMTIMVARGKYLANHVAVCMDCHSQRDFSKYAGPNKAGSEGAGGEKFDNEMFDAVPGALYSKNITPDPETGIGSWSDAEILRAITHGISKNGDTLFPIMPYATFNRMAKDDLLSIVAYLRTLKPIKNQVPPRQLMIPMSVAYPAPILQASIDGNVRPPESDPVKYGAYLFQLANCGDCHTPFVKGQPDFSHALAGGNIFNMGTFKVNTSNITPDSATGIGSWSENTFLAKFAACRQESGYNFDPGKSNTVMPVIPYSGMTDQDLKAIYAYLRTVKPINNRIVKYPD